MFYLPALGKVTREEAETYRAAAASGSTNASAAAVAAAAADAHPDADGLRRLPDEQDPVRRDAPDMCEVRQARPGLRLP